MLRGYGTDVPRDQIDTALKEIACFFEENWLQDKKGEHPLQLLWNRKDNLSTLELLTFGTALQRMKEINESWLKGQIKIIMGSDENNRRGAFFEIIGLSFFADNSSSLHPAPNSQPGFDATILSTLRETKVSCKSYGRSLHDREFERQSKETEILILDLMKKNKLRYAEFFIASFDEYPLLEDWIDLRKQLPLIIQSFQRSNRNNRIPIPLKLDVRGWTIRVRQSSRIAELALTMRSYQVMIIGQYHKNEERNLHSKLDEAQKNLNRHVTQENSVNIIYIHLPLSISVNKCSEWIKNYFVENPTSVANMVFLYQCSESFLTTEENFALTHSVHCEINPYRIASLNKKSTPYVLNIPVGYLTNETPVIRIFGDSELLSLDSHYIYQKGRIYKNPVYEEDGSMVGDSKKLAPGLHEYTVFVLNGEIVIPTMHDEHSGELLIL
ncbi:hypothetical protein PAEAM_56710 [Paenibacillus sp. GM1FR]|uniref:hypothetical protein n=1 Tax=Paenibacillus sp. GM1FR TaxID=2059267 RepID=UPI000C275200|nr:hypothetical protein [Paenibacillus sp. GM1FR]PJN48809.1 hypothetical protein PAEAM_56710 [Paenibacillus sp. GM1FR]